MIGEPSRGVCVEEDEVGGNKGVEDLLPTSLRSGIAGMRIPCGTVGIEIPQDDSIIRGGKEILKGRGEIGRAGRGRGDIYVENPKWSVVNDGGDGEVLCSCVMGEE